MKIFILLLEKMMLQLLRSITKSFKFKVRSISSRQKTTRIAWAIYMLYDFSHITKIGNDSRICVSRHA